MEPQTEARQERLGGARADFVANLGRRVAELSATLRAWQGEPTGTRMRDDMHRRVHALAAGARLLRFAPLAEELCACERRLDEVAARGELGAEDVRALVAMLDRMPALAWGPPLPVAGAAPLAAPPAAASPAHAAAPRTISSQPATRVGGEAGAPRSEPLARSPLGQAGAGVAGAASPARVALSIGAVQAGAAPTIWPLTALVVGPSQLADALGADLADPGTADSGGGFEVERTEDNTIAIDLARAVAPDLVVVDTDLHGARQLVEALLSDPLTEPVPVVVVGHWARPEDAAPYVALGVARALAKPVSPDALRRACEEVTATYVRREVRREPLGELTLDQLGARLAEELHRGLCDAADAKGRSAPIALGEGAEVLAALWGAVARIRDICTIRASGAVRFAPTGPEGALPLAPWLGSTELALGERAAGSTRARSASAQASPGLEKTVAVVADDDAAVTWFLAGVLRSAGVIVHEAHDGSRALELAQRVAPDLVVSDVLMPGLDGFALCRALKRDVALRDVPVILLSWKEDLLQRVRELGADAEGYLRKEASATAILERVREVMRPRQRVVERLARGGEIRGRLDGLTTRTLLGITCAHRPASTLAVRDASFLYEVEIRDGRPVRATRTTSEGTFQRGPRVLAALLGVGAGRFVVSPASESTVRADLEGSLADQLLPPIAWARAAQGLLSGAALIRVEQVGVDQDRLGAYLDATPEPARSLLCTVAAGASPRALITSGQTSARLLEDVLCDAAAHGAVVEVRDRSGAELLGPAAADQIEVLRGVRRSLAPPMALPPAMGGLPSFTETASPGPVILASQAIAVEAIGDAPEARRSETPKVGWTAAPAISAPEDAAADAAADEPDLEAPEYFQSPPPVAALAPAWSVARSLAKARPAPEPAIVVEAVPVREAAPRVAARAAEPAVVRADPAPPAPVVRAEPAARVAPPAATLGSLTPPPVAPRAAAVVVEETTPPTPRPVKARKAAVEVEETPVRRAPRPSAYAPSAPAAPARDNRVAIWVLFAVAGIAFAVAARWAREREAPVPAAAAELAPAAPPPAAAAPAAEPAPTAQVDTATGTEDLELRDADKVAPGQGMLEVVAGPGNAIYVDGRLIGSGPTAKAALAQRKEPYEVRVKLRGEDQVRFVLVKEGRLTRLRVAPPWSR